MVRTSFCSGGTGRDTTEPIQSSAIFDHATAFLVGIEPARPWLGIFAVQT